MVFRAAQGVDARIQNGFGEFRNEVDGGSTFGREAESRGSEEWMSFERLAELLWVQCAEL